MINKILYSSAALLFVVSGAYAADVPTEAVAPAPVDYVKVCDAYGTGFFYIPGTETCLNINGKVSAGVTYTRFNDVRNAYNTEDVTRSHVSANIGFDARTASDLGTVRSVFGIRTDNGVSSTDGVSVDNAYIQVGGLKAGYSRSMFNTDVLYGENNFGLDSSDVYLMGLNYSPLGLGFDRRNGISYTVDNLGGGFYVGVGVEDPENNKLDYYYNSSTGSSTPNVVANLGIASQDWGSADLSMIYSNELNNLLGVKATGDLKLATDLNSRLTAAYYNADGDYGYQLGAAVQYSLNDSVDLYTGVAYYNVDSDVLRNTGLIGANIGADYKIVEGLKATGEVAYGKETKDDVDAFSGVLKITRSW